MEENNLTGDLARGNINTMSENSNLSVRPPGPFFICFCGKKQTGKDTSMEFVKQMLRDAGKSFVSASFAEPLKDKICADILGIDRALLFGSNEDKETLTHIMWDTLPLDIRVRYSKVTRGPRSGPMTVREVLQVVGTDIFRNMLMDNVWVSIPFNKDYKDTNVVIITDVRFPNEVNFINKYGGVVIRLEREAGPKDNHPSETLLDTYSFERTYHNNGSLDDRRTYIFNQLKELSLI
jgi:hypothetical protein